MGTYYIGEIIMFGGSYAIRDFSLCHGQLIQIAQNEALYSILATTFGGDGQSTFGVPDMRGRAPVGSGGAPWGQSFSWGQPYGSPEVRLNVGHLPTHTHGVAYDASGGSGGEGGGITVQDTPGDEQSPSPDTYIAQGKAQNGLPVQNFTKATGNKQKIKGVSAAGFDVDRLSVEPTGDSQPVNLAAPRLAISFMICMQGNYPPRN